MEDDRSLTAKEKRQEQITRWKNSATDLECPTYANPKVRVKFDDGAVFLAACSSGDLDEVRILLKNGADINFANVDGLTALHQACIDGNVEVVEFLVEHGSEIDQEDNEGWTPLHATASCGFMDIAKYLVKKGANVAAVNSEAELPIDIAEEDEMVEYLQSEIDNKGIDVDEARDIERLFMLEDANILLDKYQNGEKVEIYRHSKSGATALHICAAKGYNDVLKILIKAGIDVNSRDHDGWTPLHAASHWSQEESSKILADRNADFKSRSNLGQTPFDVADEDMLEYLRDLETEQSENKPNIKTTPVIEPPPLKSDKKSSPSTKESSDILRINEMQNGEKRSRKMLEEESPDSSSSEEEEDSITSATRISSPPPIKSHETKSSSRTSSLSNDQSDDFISSYNSRRNRPASLHISSSEPPHHRPLQMTNSEGGSKPIAATQPVQAVGRTSRENGSRTTLLSRDKDDTPSAWRTGLRKTGSFDEKSKISMQNLQNKEIERSSSYSTRFSEETKNETKTARVAPILDASKSKTDAETDESNDLLSRFGRRKYDTNQSATTDPTPDTSASFKRSISYKKAVGRTESLENHDDANIEALTKRPKTFSKISEDDSEKESPTTTTTASNDAAAAASKSVDSRRSHLQPVRDEEAEAQRRIRSRRERQTRRSTQGVTLDVVEEAMRTIGQFRKQKPATDKTSTDTPDSRTDTSSTYLRGSDDTQQPASSSSQSSYFTNTATSSSTPVTSLPSGYIPSDQRVKGGAESASTSSNSKSAALSVPSISVDPTVSEGENDKGDKSSGENGLSAAQKRRRNRKERRSTGIPDAKPSSTATENNDGEEDEVSSKEDNLDSGKAERLRMKYDSSSLPNRHERHNRSGVRASDSDIPSRLTQSQTASDEISYSSSRNRTTDTKNYKKLYEDNQVENDRLKNDLAEAQRKVGELEARLEKAEENSARKQALENEKRERRALERKLADVEQELQNSESAEKIRTANGQLKAENTALQRIVEKLGGSVPDVISRVINESPAPLSRERDSLHLPKNTKMKSESAPDLRKLDEIADNTDRKKEESRAKSIISRSSSSSSLSEDDKVVETRRASSASIQGSDTSVRSRSLKDRSDSPASSIHSDTTYSLRRKARLEASSSSPSLLSRTHSPRRSPASSYSSGLSDYGRSSSTTHSRYTSRRDTPSSALSSAGSYTIPISSSRREFLKTLPPSTKSSTSASSFRTAPTPYSSSSTSYSPKSTYGSSASSRPRHGYSSTLSSSTGRTGTSKTTPLSSYTPKYSSMSSSRRRKY
uniref:protein phosphatase 1 regulatory subunit 12A-like isoform X1 n=1 Tax=Styela clava TaxID=7725 RepID=UPI00193A008E|nr:protein phosphatase 1 regulatory subunit 12A-like isoform X1 [Styela clava]